MPYRPLFEPHVKEYLGVDFSGNALADRSLEHTGALPFDSESVDVVLSSQVLEHVSDPSAYLMEAYRVLGQEGRLILSTHGLWKYHPDPTDFWRWTCDGLRREIGRAGFEIVQFRGVMGPAATALQLWQDAVLHNVPRPFLTLFTRCMQLLIRRADIRCLDKNRDRDACVYVLVAKKKP
jgi:SAM-dependent methyltransferase